MYLIGNIMISLCNEMKQDLSIGWKNFQGRLKKSATCVTNVF